MWPNTATSKGIGTCGCCRWADSGNLNPCSWRASASLVVSVLSYRRGLNRIAPFFEYSNDVLLDGKHVATLAVVIENRGSATVQIRAISVNIPGKATPILMGQNMYGPELPAKIEPNHMEHWTIPIQFLLAFSEEDIEASEYEGMVFYGRRKPREFSGSGFHLTASIRQVQPRRPIGRPQRHDH